MGDCAIVWFGEIVLHNDFIGLYQNFDTCGFANEWSLEQLFGESDRMPLKYKLIPGL